jgi:L-ascorbate metabolism protein UlaG (beta-lactamase superfamily)
VRGGPSALAAVLAAAGGAAVLLGACSNVNPYYDPARPHHRPDGFTNVHGPAGGRPFSQFLRWQIERSREGLPRPPSQHVPGYDGFPVVRPDLALLHANHRGPRVTVTWIGHATLYVQMGGRNLLFDANFSQRASPVSFAGPQRRVPLPVTLDELPPVDVVLTSHNHYDHLDEPTVRQLIAQRGGQPLFVAPLGMDLWLREVGATRVERFDWWDRHRLLGLEITMTPVQHWSARSLNDRNATLWGGWAVRADGFSFWFSGDCGYSQDFRDIGERFGGFDLAALAVGGYEPRWFMQDQHINPLEAVQAFLDLRAKQAVGVHWGTFELTDEPLDAPIGELPRALDALGVARDRFVLYRHGETRTYR